MSWALNLVELAFDGLWHIPEGVATLFAGVLALGAGVLAWRGVQQQIKSEQCREDRRHIREVASLQQALTAELLAFSAAVVPATSLWNQRALQNPDADPPHVPVFPEPLVYRAVLGQLGLLTQGWPASAVITFYANMIELSDIAKEAVAGHPSAGQTNAVIAGRLRIMSSNLAEALSGLNDERLFPISPELELDGTIRPDGRPILEGGAPESLQELLFRLSGRAWVALPPGIMAGQ